MEPELLVCDIGNTSMKIGLANEKRVLDSYALPVRNAETADSLGFWLLGILRQADVARASLRACVACSVVPAMEPILREAVARYLGCPLFFTPGDLPIPLENRYERHEEVGADRLVGSYAARRAIPQARSLIVVDFGTATTFDCVTGDAYLGGLIFPGPLTSLAALSASTARLPHVNLDVRGADPAIGRDTATSIRHGLVFGFFCVAQGLCAMLRRQLEEPARVVATGGFATAIGRLGAIFDNIMPTLLLEGLRGLYFEACPRNGGQ